MKIFSYLLTLVSNLYDFHFLFFFLFLQNIGFHTTLNPTDIHCMDTHTLTDTKKHFSKYLLCVSQKKTVLQIWNDMRVRMLWIGEYHILIKNSMPVSFLSLTTWITIKWGDSEVSIVWKVVCAPKKVLCAFTEQLWEKER